MDKNPLKARQIEALTFIFHADAPAAGTGVEARRRWWSPGPAVVFLTTAVVVVAAVALIMF